MPSLPAVPGYPTAQSTRVRGTGEPHRQCYRYPYPSQHPYLSQIPYPSQYPCFALLCTLPLQEAKPGSGRARTDSAAMSLCATALRTVSTATPCLPLPLPRCVVRCAALLKA